MTKVLSTYERKMKDKNFKKAYEKGYQELLFSELLVSVMDSDDKSVRMLAKEAKLSPSVIQDIRSGKQQDIKLSNLIKIANAFGYQIFLQKGEEKLELYDEIRNSRHHLGVIASYAA
jgi:hypothetical protein